MSGRYSGFLLPSGFCSFCPHSAILLFLVFMVSGRVEVEPRGRGQSLITVAGKILGTIRALIRGWLVLPGHLSLMQVAPSPADHLALIVHPLPGSSSQIFSEARPSRASTLAQHPPLYHSLGCTVRQLSQSLPLRVVSGKGTPDLLLLKPQGVHVKPEAVQALPSMCLWTCSSLRAPFQKSVLPGDGCISLASMDERICKSFGPSSASLHGAAPVCGMRRYVPICVLNQNGGRREKVSLTVTSSYLPCESQVLIALVRSVLTSFPHLFSCLFSIAMGTRI